jgi:hypothetical protein
MQSLTTPIRPEVDFATKAWVIETLDKGIREALKASEKRTNEIASGLACRLAHQLPKMVARGIVAANPNLKFDVEELTACLQAELATDTRNR